MCVASPLEKLRHTPMIVVEQVTSRNIYAYTYQYILIYNFNVHMYIYIYNFMIMIVLPAYVCAHICISLVPAEASPRAGVIDNC